MAPPTVSAKPDKISGYLLKQEHRSIGGPTKKKYWFVLDTDSPFLYWFKAATDITCVGRIALSGAAFTFDPRHKGQFEIHANGEIHIFETLDNKSRAQWLQFLQNNRRRHYERENVDSILNVEIMSPASHSNLSNLGKLSTLHAVDAVTTIPEETPSTSTSATMSPVGGAVSHPSDTRFYLGTDGELIASSFDLPSVPPAAPNRDLIKSAERVLSKIADGTQSRASILEEDAKKAIGKARRSIRLPSFASREKIKPKCEQCIELAALVEDLKDRCYELTDEVAANQDLVCALRNALVSAHNQRDAVMKVHNISEIEQLNFIIERESKLTNLQISNAELKREVSSLRETEKTLTRENQHLQTAIDAFKTSVITKDELIMKMCETQDDMEKRHREHRQSYADMGDIGIPEAIPVDGGLSPEEATRILTEEVNVDDVYELRDLVLGYESQNKFLNNEVLELQHIVDGLEARERKIIRQNFEIEAWFYQLKSRYMMVLNHVRNGFAEAQKKLSPTVIEELIDDVNRPLKFQHRTDAISPQRPSLSVILNSTAEGSETDALGFFIRPPKFGSPKTSIAGTPAEQPTPSQLTVSESSEVIVDKAAQLKNLSYQILKNIQTEESKQYLDWLQKWDCFLVNHASAVQLASSPDLKALVRQGVPHTYRSRVWKCLVQIHVADAQADAGKGYYECLLRKADKLENPATDGSLRQIDLDLARTLPNNIHFTDVNSDKMIALKRVLYAFRFHCKSVEYCQGLNRIAAVALLYLREDDAFWFLVSVVEYLQPPGYYTNTLHGAITDQKVMMDLVQEWVPKVHHHLKALDVDLSLFTLPWFLTIFVDVLSHDLYLPIFDAYLLEGNKVIFRFALGLLRTLEARLLACTTVGAVHSCLSNLATLDCTPKDLAKAAFHDLYSFPAKSIETKRVHYASQAAKNNEKR
uniref:PH domain-containing protein n=1 Tax=Panagrellus redivivus TaxID=6233 RepID=A0A7E4ZZW5_PANRE